MSIKNFLLIFLAQVLYCFPLFSADPVLLNCIKTPEIYDLDAGPKDFHHSNNLRRKPGSPNVAAGELIHIVGRVTDINCLPIQNAVVSIWHANSNGVNHYDKDIEGVKIDPDFAGSGRFVVNNLGYYNFITIMPGKSDNRAPHINFLIQHPDFPEFKTQMFFAENSCSNCADSVLQDSELITNGLASLLIVPFTYNDQVAKTYTFNITLDECNKFSEKK